MRALHAALDNQEFASLKRVEAPLAEPEAALLCHPERYVEAIRKAVPTEGLARIDMDTTVSPGSWEAAMRAIGAALHAVDAVAKGEAKNAFCAVRPPGHHAETAKAMGFCLFDTVAIAARHAQKAHGIGARRHRRLGRAPRQRHAGDLLVRPIRALCLDASDAAFPGHRRAVGDGRRQHFQRAAFARRRNAPSSRRRCASASCRRSRNFEPDLILISAGFDAHHRDPLAEINLEAEDFAWATAELMEIADKSAGGRVVALLEGGYDLKGLAASSAAHIRQLMAA